jgi:hypothetical protein
MMRASGYDPSLGGSMTRRPGVGAIVALLLLLSARDGVAAECSTGSFDSTFALIQAAVFERNGCTAGPCHGSAATSSGLDLRADAAYDALIDVDARTPPIPGWKRVLVGQAEASLLWVNLAAKVKPDLVQAPLRAMPLDPQPAVSEAELEAVRLWIEKGAPRTGVVPGTAELLDACLPPPEPIEIKPLPPPPPGTGVQIRMPRWELPGHTEHEVCFASYYDVTDQVPEQFRGPTGTFRYKFHQTRQDPLSHHMVPVLYEGVTAFDSPLWGEFRCRGGARDGELCDPFTAGACGADAECSSPIKESVACIGYGPGDGGIGLTTAGISITQQTAEEFYYAPGVYGELPLKGMILWSSHAFNLTDKAGKLEAWLNFEFAPPDEQQTPVEEIFEAANVFKANAPAFGTDEPCAISTFPRHTQVFELSSHMHKRGKRWRTFRGAFRCQGGAADGQACSPVGYDFASRDLCAGAPCGSLARQPVGDCDLDQQVTVAELVAGVGVALGQQPLTACADADADGDQAVAINELLRAVGAALNGVPPLVPRDPDDSLLYVSLVYNDPVVLRMRDPIDLASPLESERSFTFCALYDNGFTDPSEVKRRSTSPPPPLSLPFGGPCAVATHCTDGRPQAPCSGATQAERDASCDSSPGAGDGFCDACPLIGGVTTEDEMFILLGHYFVR